MDNEVKVHNAIATANALTREIIVSRLGEKTIRSGSPRIKVTDRIVEVNVVALSNGEIEDFFVGTTLGGW